MSSPRPRLRRRVPPITAAARSVALGALLAAAACTEAEEPGGGSSAGPQGSTAAALATSPGTVSLRLPVAAANASEAARRLLDDPADLRVASVRHSLTGDHVRFAVLAADGTPVADAEVGVHLAGGAPTYVTRLVRANVQRPLVLTGARRLSDREAEDRARAVAVGADPASPAADASLVDLLPAALPAGPAAARAGWRALVATTEPRHLWEIWIDGESGAATVRRDRLMRLDGSGYVYQPNPIVVTGDTSLQDDNDADSTVLTAALSQVVLLGLDGTGHLSGEYADVENGTGRASNAALVFEYTRSFDYFEEVNAYYHVDRIQRHLQALGFTGARAIQAAPFKVYVNAFSDDNSYFDPWHNAVSMGSGGVDDAEDGDIIAHEYGHALANGIVSDFGASAEALALGEGTSDLIAASTPTGVTDLLTRACVGAWDATSYATGSPPCLRRVDGEKHYPEHLERSSHPDGEIWSGAVWDLYDATGLGPVNGLQLVIEAFFDLSASATFEEAAQALLSADQGLHAGAHQESIRRVLTWHGLLSDIEPPASFGGAIQSVPVAVESPHPIPNLADGQETITIAGATALRLHFSSFSMSASATCPDSKCDSVYLYDAAGRLYAKLSGSLGAFDAPAIPGDTVIVRWVSNSATASTGFVIDRVDATGDLPDGGPADGSPEASDAIPGDAGDQTDAPPATDGASNASDAGDDDAGGDGCDCRVGRAPGPGGLSAGLLLLGVAAALGCRRRRR